MAHSNAMTVAAYLAGLPPAVRATVARVRRLVKHHLPGGYREAMNWGAITYEVPLRRYPTTYNGQPLCYVALAAQKGYVSLYLMGAYRSPVLSCDAASRPVSAERGSVSTWGSHVSGSARWMTWPSMLLAKSSRLCR